MQQYDVLIVGGGISGLSMAHYCAHHGWQTLLLEKTPRLGGAIHSHTFPETPDFWVEMGSHTCFNSYGQLLAILEQYDLLPKTIKKQASSFRFLVDNQLKSIPSQLHYFELLTHIWNLFRLSKQGKSVTEYYTPLFGKKNYQSVFSPAFNAVICQPADDFPADKLFRKKKRRKEVLRSFTFAEGLQLIPDTLVRQANLTVLTNESVQSFDYENNQFTLTTASSQHYIAPKAVLATPVHVSASLLANSFPKVSRVLEQVNPVDVYSVAVVLPKEKLNLPALAGIIAKDDAFYSLVSRDTVAHPNYRGFTFHFKNNKLTEEAQLKRIADVLYVKPDDFSAVYRKQNVLPALRAGHDLLMEVVDTQLNDVPLGLTGNYFVGVSLEECVLRSRAEFERLIQL